MSSDCSLSLQKLHVEPDSGLQKQVLYGVLLYSFLKCTNKANCEEILQHHGGGSQSVLKQFNMGTSHSVVSEIRESLRTLSLFKYDLVNVNYL